jgi:hypothetical protein
MYEKFTKNGGGGGNRMINMLAYFDFVLYPNATTAKAQTWFNFYLKQSTLRLPGSA